MTQHLPVLATELVTNLQIQPDLDYIDATIGAGGHAQDVLVLNEPQGRLIGFDLDQQAILIARENLKKFGGRVIYLQKNFGTLYKTISDLHLPELHLGGIYADLGVSSMQLDQVDKGFSFRAAGPLAMNFDKDGTMSAEDIVNNWSVEEIAQIIVRYGEDTFGPLIAKAIGDYRQKKKITDTLELAKIIESVKQRRGSKIHPATKTFQALRIVVNDELGMLAEFLEQAVQLLPSQARLAIITYHSLEDRVVKQYFKKEATDCLCPKELPVCFCHHQARVRLITKKSIRPSEQEIKNNPRSRSAKLRVIEKI